MNGFPYMTQYINGIFTRENQRWDHRFLRPPLVVLYFFLRLIAFPLKFIFHRHTFGFEARCIDGVLAFGLKYLATREAVELLVRHVQIEPLLYRHLLIGQDPSKQGSVLNGIQGDFNLKDLRTMIRGNLTIGHDDLSYELVDSFDRAKFLENLEAIRRAVPDDHQALSKEILETNERHSLQWFGATTVVMMIVYSITIFADLHTAVRALNSFVSDSIALWALKHLYRSDPDIQTDLDFYMQVYSNRSHYNSSAFFSDPSQYLYYHIVFDEYAYEALRNRPPMLAVEGA